MKFSVMTLFPDMIKNGLSTSILGRAQASGTISIEAINIRDYTTDKHGRVDDYTYGGGAGMLIQAQPVYDAYRSIVSRSHDKYAEKTETIKAATENVTIAEQDGSTVNKKIIRTIYVTPQGTPFTQKLAEDFAKEDELIFICGHYEGIDERVLEEIVTDYVSLGDYVLTGGELPAMVMIDCISRLVPGVLNNDESAETESFFNDLLEYPQYSRPQVWHNKEVPQVLMSGDHKKIVKWRLEKSIEKTRRIRPDLYAKYEERVRAIEVLSRNKRNHINMMESLDRGQSDIVFEKEGAYVLYDRKNNQVMITPGSLKNRAETEVCQLFDMIYLNIPKAVDSLVVMGKELADYIINRGEFILHCECYQVCYTKKEPLPVRFKDIRAISMDELPYVREHYTLVDSDEYIIDRIKNNALFGAFINGKIAGFAGFHDEGSIGMLYVDEKYRGQGIAAALESYCINRQREKDYTPYGHIIVGNNASLALQEKLGLYVANEHIFWLGKNK